MKLFRPHPGLRATVQDMRHEHPELDLGHWPLVPNFFFYIEDVRVSSHRDVKALQVIAQLVGYSGPLTEPEPEEVNTVRGRRSLKPGELV